MVKIKPIKFGDSDKNYTQTFVTGKGLIWLTRMFSDINIYDKYKKLHE
jgi:hypothetical protein